MTGTWEMQFSKKFVMAGLDPATHPARVCAPK
jgi:hypothetical protein